MKMGLKVVGFAFLVALSGSGHLRAQVVIEYIAHASFVIESPQGIRIVIDPFSSYTWPSYIFPEGVEADAVFVTHPHYDHDASYSVGGDAMVFRKPGRYAIGDIEIKGISGKHANFDGLKFGQTNTIWLFEVGGLRIAHLGDNGPLTDENVRELGRVDILMMPIDSEYHILKREEIETMRRRLRPRLLVPMHYKIRSLYASDRYASVIRGLGPIDPWLEGKADVRRLESNRASFNPQTLPETRGIIVFNPSPEVRPHSLELIAARSENDWEKVEELAPGAVGYALNRESQREQAIHVLELGLPASGRGTWERRALTRSGLVQSIHILERGLAASGRGDWEQRTLTRSRLAQYYREAGLIHLAAQQYRLILDESHQIRSRQRAREFLESLK